jgi:hypothetical protein
VAENVFYVDAKTKIVDFLTANFENFPVKLQNRFLNFFPVISNYQEEGVRYHPRILFTNNIDAIAKNIPFPKKVEMFYDSNENRFDQRIRALVPFCKHDWYIYIDVASDGVRYGLFKNVGSIKDESTEDAIFTNLESSAKISSRASAILVFANTRWTVTMRSFFGKKLNTNFALDILAHSDMDNEVTQLVEASFSRLKTTPKKVAELKNMFANVFKNVLRDIGGTICVVVDKDYQRDQLFADGVWLTEPISLSKLFMSTSNYHEQMLTSVADLFLSMLNKDGITVVNNIGEILAFNVFVETNLKEVGSIIGGARKRAAYTIINSKRRDIDGVYFQSYDGEIFYSPVKK